jgi:hypothetical protein
MDRSSPPLLALATALAAVAGCGGGGDPGGALARGTVGPGGGMIQGGGVTLRIPAGALAADTAVTIQKLDGALTVPQPGLNVVASYRLNPDRTTFSKPIGVALAIEPARLPPEATKTGNALVLVHAASDGSDPEVIGAWVGGESTLAGLASSFSLFEVAVLSTADVGRCPVSADVRCTTDLVCDDAGVCGGVCSVVVGTAGDELSCASGGANAVTCTCHGPTATANDSFLLPPFLGPNPPVRLVWEYLRHCDPPCPADAGAD